jgi:hypothetical protein
VGIIVYIINIDSFISIRFGNVYIINIATYDVYIVSIITCMNLVYIINEVSPCTLSKMIPTITDCFVLIPCPWNLVYYQMFLDTKPTT